MAPPPPAEPIRPIGPLAGGSYVARSSAIGRVERRREDRPDDERDREGEHPDEHPGDTPRRPPTPIRDSRSYDDHGRRPGVGTHPELPHIDATA